MKTQNYVFCQRYAPTATVEKMIENISKITSDPNLTADDPDFKREMQARPVNILEVGDKILLHHATGGRQNDDGITTGCKWIWVECIVSEIMSETTVWVKFNREFDGGTYRGLSYGLHDGCVVNRVFEPTNTEIKTPA